MKKSHPEWGERQCRNLLYWHNKVNKRLKEKAKQYLGSLVEKDMRLIEIPEATGVNVFQTCANVGISLEKDPSKQVIKIMFIAKYKRPQV